MPHPDGGVGLLDLRRIQRVLSDVGAVLQEGIDAVVDSVHGHHLDVAPAEPGAREVTEHVVPDREMRTVFTGEALALDVVDGLDRRVLPHEEPDHQRRAAHHEPHVGRVGERVATADLMSGAAVGEPEVDSVLDAELHLARIDERQHRAGPGVRLDGHLIAGPAAHDLGDAAGQREVHRAGGVGPDGDRLRQGLALRDGPDGEGYGDQGHDESEREHRAAHGPPRPRRDAAL